MTSRWTLETVAVILVAMVLASCSAAATPTLEVEFSEGLIAARQVALSYVLKTHGEQVFPAPGSNWQTQRTTPDGIVGSESSSSLSERSPSPSAIRWSRRIMSSTS